MKIRNLLAIVLSVLILLSFTGCAAAEMDKAVSEQNFERAAMLRDEIKKMKGEN